jgi:hypothetical protein
MRKKGKKNRAEVNDLRSELASLKSERTIAETLLQKRIDDLIQYQTRKQETENELEKRIKNLNARLDEEEKTVVFLKNQIAEAREREPVPPSSPQASTSHLPPGLPHRSAKPPCSGKSSAEPVVTSTSTAAAGSSAETTTRQSYASVIKRQKPSLLSYPDREAITNYYKQVSKSNFDVTIVWGQGKNLDPTDSEHQPIHIAIKTLCKCNNSCTCEISKMEIQTIRKPLGTCNLAMIKTPRNAIFKKALYSILQASPLRGKTYIKDVSSIDWETTLPADTPARQTQDGPPSQRMPKHLKCFIYKVPLVSPVVQKPVDGATMEIIKKSIPEAKTATVVSSTNTVAVALDDTPANRNNLCKTISICFGKTPCAVKLEQTTRIAQCHNCQQYGHGHWECSNSSACAKCAGTHKTENHQGEIITRCVNCKEDGHPAWSAGCRVRRQAFLNIRGTQPAKLAMRPPTRAKPPIPAKGPIRPLMSSPMPPQTQSLMSCASPMPPQPQSQQPRGHRGGYNRRNHNGPSFHGADIEQTLSFLTHMLHNYDPRQTQVQGGPFPPPAWTIPRHPRH